MNEPLDLAPELAHKQRIEDLALMRKMEKKHQFPVSRYEIKDVMAELNIRIMQYSQSSYSTDFKVLQTIQDYQYLITPLQTFGKKQTINQRMAKAKIDITKPFASMKDGKLIYFDGNVFTMEKPK